MQTLWKIAVNLYPYDFRAMFAGDMLAALDRGPASVRELISIVFGAAREWAAKLTTDPYVRARSLPDVRMMRPAGISKETWFGASAEKPRCAADTSP